MSTAIAEEKNTGTKLNQLEQLKKFTKVVADTADFESMKEFQAAGRDDEPESGLRRYSKAAIRASAGWSFKGAQKLWFERPSADRRHLRSSARTVRLRHSGDCAGTSFD